MPAQIFPAPWTASHGKPAMIQAIVCLKSSLNSNACAGAYNVPNANPCNPHTSGYTIHLATRGIFFGNSENGVLNFGKFFSRADAHQISCCRACADAYQDAAKAEGARFASKLNNLKKARRIRLNDEKIGEGSGHSKKEAEQDAARSALESEIF